MSASQAKPDHARARRNKTNPAAQPKPHTVYELVRGTAPDLTADMLGEANHWHPMTLQWWESWKISEIAKDFTQAEWAYLLDTALIHHQFWVTGDSKHAAEVRARTAKFGVTPEDRAKLRITFADADEREDRNERTGSAQRRAGTKGAPVAPRQPKTAAEKKYGKLGLVG